MESNGKVCGIYLIRNKINGKCYVGQSIDIEKRFNQHKKLTGSGYIKNAIVKYGIDNFYYSILEECERDLLNERECVWIQELNTIVPNGYNLTSGGGQGTFVSEETRGKQSAASKGRFDGEDNPFYGRKHTEETKQMIGRANSGRVRSKEENLIMSELLSGENNPMYGKHHTEETKKRISEIHKGREINDQWRKNLSICQTGRKISEDAKIKNGRTKMNGRKIQCSNGCIYLSFYEASKHTGINRMNITNVCRGRTEKANGLKFWYI